MDGNKGVLIVYPSTFACGINPEFFMPPYAIYELAGVVRGAGYEVRLVDPSQHGGDIVRPAVVEELLRDIGAVAVSATSYNYREARLFAETAKSVAPEIPLILGGVHATNFDEHILRTSRFDYVVRGDGEEALLEILSRLRRREAINGVPAVSYHGDGGEVVRNPQAPRLDGGRLTDYPPAAFDLVPADTYAVLPFETSRGCQFSCFFCSINHRWNWRPLDPERIVDRLEEIVEQHGHKARRNMVCFVDDCFTTTPEHVRAICRGIERRRLPQGFVIEARIVDLLKRELTEELKRIHVAEIQIGVEAGYEAGMKRVKKGSTTCEKVIQGAALLEEYGLNDRIMWSFIVGFPWEGEKECLETVRFAGELTLRYGGAASFAWWVPFPSRGWEQRADFGLDLDAGIYDRMDWFSNPSVLRRMYPRIDMDIRFRMRDLANDYRARGALIHGV